MKDVSQGCAAGTDGIDSILAVLVYHHDCVVPKGQPTGGEELGVQAFSQVRQAMLLLDSLPC